MNQNQSAYRRNNKTEHRSSWTQRREIAEGLSRQPLTLLLKMSLWFLNTSGNVLLPLGSYWDKLAGILDGFVFFFEVLFSFHWYHKGGPENWLSHNVLCGG